MVEPDRQTTNEIEAVEAEYIDNPPQPRERNNDSSAMPRPAQPDVYDEHPVERRRRVFTYILLPVTFLTVALLGGLRLSDPDLAFVFIGPSLVCLVFAALMLVLFFRAGLIEFGEWFSERLPTLTLAANGALMLSLFAATVQLFNSLLPERGIPFWVVGFCFFWSLWTYLFAEFDARKLVRSLGALLGAAFVAKYLVLANLTAPASEGWLQGIFQNPTKEALTWLLDLPRYSGGTGYVQFFTLALYLAGLFLLPRSPSRKR